MIIDERTEFADATALDTSATGIKNVGDVIDLTNARDLSNPGNKPLYLVISIDTAPTSGGAATVAFLLVSDAQAAIATDGTATEHARTAQLAIATLVAGYSFKIPVPAEGPVYERYVGIQQNVGAFALTAGKINAFLTMDPNIWKALPDGI